MVSFSCERCNDTVKKPKANQHAQRCKDSLTCIDCSKTFADGSWNTHNSCISEAEAYQGALYKPTKKELKRKAADLSAEQAKASKMAPQMQTTAVVAGNGNVVPALAGKGTEPPKKKSKGDKNSEDAPRAQIELLHSAIPNDQKISVHKVLKLLKARNKLDKGSAKTLLKEIYLSLAEDGAIVLT